jgi:hypothetical protein
MSNDATVTFRVDADLRAEFNEAASSIPDRSGAQVLRAFMREFVDQHRQARRGAAPTAVRGPTPHPGAGAVQARREAVERARASVELEGFTVSPEALAIAERFINGQTSADAMIPELDKRWKNA